MLLWASWARPWSSIKLTEPSACTSQQLSIQISWVDTAQQQGVHQQQSLSRVLILDAARTKLYKQTAGDLIWSSMLRPDTSFAVHKLSQSFMNPTERDEEQLRSLLRYMKGTQQYSVSLGVPRKWKKAKNLDLLAFSISWTEACRSTIGVCLSFMGVPSAASIQTQATSKAAAELSSVRLACTLAFHTRSLLQDFQLDQPLSFRVLTRGPLAQKLGLSKQSRHMSFGVGWASSSLARFNQDRILQTNWPTLTQLVACIGYSLSLRCTHDLLRW